MKINDKQLKAILIEVIDETLQAVIGESGKEVVYYYLQNSYAIKKENIPENLEAFTEFLNNFFGSGAKVIEKTIMKNLCLKLGIKIKQTEDIKLTQFIKSIRDE